MSFPIRSVSNVSICLRCRLRLSSKLGSGNRSLRIPIISNMRSFSAVSHRYAEITIPAPQPRKRRGLQLEKRDILVLELPAPKPRKKKEVQMDMNVDIQSLSESLLIFEGDSNVDIARMELSLIRPASSKVSKERYQQLYDQLDKGFNRSQIMAYYEHMLQESQSRTTEESSIDSQSHKSLKSFLKGDLMDLILQDIWGVEVAEGILKKEDFIMSKAFNMNREDIYFLIGQNGLMLRQWAQDYSARITVNVQTSVLQFDASQVSIENLEKRIPEILEKKLVEEIDLTGLSRFTNFNTAFITQIATLTGTYMHPPSETNSIRVSTIGSPHQIDDARRLIYNSYGLRPQEHYCLLVDGSFSPDVSSSKTLEGALYRIVEDESLSWTLRGKEWARWRSVRTAQPPRAPQTPLNNPQLHKKTGIELVGDDEVASAESDISHENTDDSSGLDAIRTLLDDPAKIPEPKQTLLPPAEYFATFGYLLHNSEGQPRKTDSLPQLLESSPEREFCANIPGLNCITSGLNLHPSVASQSHRPEPDMEFKSTSDSRHHNFILHFAASPWVHPDSFERYPPVEMALDLDPVTGAISGRPKLTANYYPVVADLMLPNRDCDIRFSRKIKLPIHKPRAPGLETTGVGKGVQELEEEPQVAQDQKIIKAKGGVLDERKSPENYAGKENVQIEPELLENIGKSQVIFTEDKGTAAQTTKRELFEDGTLLDLDQTGNILEYLHNSKLNPLKENLVPAKEITLKIPKFLISEDSESENESGSETSSENELGKQGEAEGGTTETKPTPIQPMLPTSTETVPVTYLFTSMEYRSTLPLLLQRYERQYKLTKTLIEGGRSGGKRVEVTVDYPGVDGSGAGDGEKKKRFEKYVFDVLYLVDKMENMNREGGWGI